MSEEPVGRDDLSPPLRRALDAAFPDRRVAAVGRSSGSGHPGNAVLRVELAAGSPPAAYLKVATDDWGDERARRDAAVTRYAHRHAPVRVPRVLAAADGHDADANAEDVPPYVATAALSGVPLADDVGTATPVNVDALATAFRRTGVAMAGVHALSFDTPGRVVGGDETALDVAAAPWAETLRERVVTDPPVPERVPDLPDRASALLDESAALLSPDDGAMPGRVTLVHEDLYPGNVLAGRPPGVIDFESAMVGDPGYDLARTEDAVLDGRPDLDRATRERVRDALYAGYRAGADAFGTPTGPDGLPPGYRRRRPTYRVLTHLSMVHAFEHWAADVPADSDELLDWIRETFDRRLAAAREATVPAE